MNEPWIIPFAMTRPILSTLVNKTNDSKRKKKAIKSKKKIQGFNYYKVSKQNYLYMYIIYWHIPKQLVLRT